MKPNTRHNIRNAASNKLRGGNTIATIYSHVAVALVCSHKHSHAAEQPADQHSVSVSSSAKSRRHSEASEVSAAPVIPVHRLAPHNSRS